MNTGREQAQKIDLRELFSSLQTVLEAKLHVGRKVIEHPGAKGQAAEADWRAMMEVLPTRYQVTKAFVVDSDAGVSDEIDVVVHDRQYSPLLFRHGEAAYVPAESVYAVFEIKPELSRDTVEYAAQKIESVRLLRRTSVPIAHAGGRFEPKEPFPILGGLLCLDSSWNPAFGQPLSESLLRVPMEGRLDLGCVVRHGTFEATYAAGGVKLNVSAPDTGLTFFLLSFLHRLQEFGTVPAMDLRKYATHL